ncbi:hypothetical protein [Clostridium sp.]|uniref:hypothetical protein n=1 Tax=Clostridium sp. TaxID=1506 RepID=UPI003F2D903F
MIGYTDKDKICICGCEVCNLLQIEDKQKENKERRIKIFKSCPQCDTKWVKIHGNTKWVKVKKIDEEIINDKDIRSKVEEYFKGIR